MILLYSLENWNDDPAWTIHGDASVQTFIYYVTCKGMYYSDGFESQKYEQNLPSLLHAGSIIQELASSIQACQESIEKQKVKLC